MLRFQILTYCALLVILGLYSEEAVHYYFYRHSSTIFPLSSPNCRPVPGDLDFAWCDVAGYGRTRSQRSMDSYSYVDPSSPKQSWDEINERNRVYNQMFTPPQHDQSTERH